MAILTMTLFHDLLSRWFSLEKKKKVDGFTMKLKSSRIPWSFQVFQFDHPWKTSSWRRFTDSQHHADPSSKQKRRRILNVMLTKSIPLPMNPLHSGKKWNLISNPECIVSLFCHKRYVTRALLYSQWLYEWPMLLLQKKVSQQDIP